jgi:hypothetical protein
MVDVDHCLCFRFGMTSYIIGDQSDSFGVPGLQQQAG